MDKWKIWEREVATALDLDFTVSSGNQFFDSGDVTTRGRDDPFPLWADCKFTEKISFTLKLRDLSWYSERAAEVGKRFVLPLRFQPKGASRPQDYVVMSFHDFMELREALINVLRR